MRLFIILNVIVAIIFIVRLLVDGKVSRKLQYAIWLVLPVFVITYSLISIPVSIRLPHKVNTLVSGVVNDNQKAITNVLTDRYEKRVQEYAVPANNDAANSVSTDSAETNKPNNNTVTIHKNNSSNTSVKSNQAKHNISLKSIAFVGWLSGAVVVAFVLLLNNIRFVRKVHRTRKYYGKESLCKLKVYKLNKIVSPFLLGRSIYLSSAMNEESTDYKYAVCHECCHYKHGDNIWPILEYVFLVVLWFDPLIWIAYKLIRQDSELAADEHVVEIMGNSNKAEYSRTLVGFISPLSKTDNFLTASTSMNGKNKSFIKARIRSIMKGTQRSIAATLAIVIIITGIISCSMIKPVKAKAREMEYVQESDWYNTTVYKTNGIPNFNTASGDELIFLDSNTFVAVEEFGSLYNDEIAQLSMYELIDGECKLVNTFDLKANGLRYVSEDWSESISISKFSVVNGRFYGIVTQNSFDEDGNIIWDSYVQEIDFYNNCLGETIRNKDIEELTSGNNSLTVSWTYDGVQYYMGSSFDEEGIFGTKVYQFNDAFEKVSEKTLSYDGASVGYFHFCQADSNHGVLLSTDFISSVKAYLVDLETFELELIDNAPSELLDPSWVFSNGRMYLVSDLGIYSYNVETNSIEVIVDFNKCNVNRDDFIPMLNKVVLIDDDIFTYRACVEDNALLYKIYRFSYSETNPNAGKGILKLADLTGDYKVSEAIYEFNNVSDSAYIILDDRYTIKNYMKDIDDNNAFYDYEFTEEYKNSYRNAQAEVSSMLRADISSGEGPDIILNAQGLYELSNASYLVDLKKEFQKRDLIDFDDYLPALFSEDEVYSVGCDVLPIGITWHDKYGDILDLENGLSYDKYDALVSDVCNGKDPISETFNRDDYFLLLFNNSFDRFISGNTVNLDNDDFKMLAEFASTRSKTMQPDNDSFWFIKDAEYSMNGTFLFDNMQYDIPSGLPTYSGETAIRLTSQSSFAISVSCPLLDEACEFLTIAMESDESIRIDSIREEAINYMNEINWKLENYPEYFICPDEAGFDGSEIEEYIELLKNADGFTKSDSDINVILVEEIQPYFAGDKTIEEVIPIIESRINLVLGER